MQHWKSPTTTINSILTDMRGSGALAHGLGGGKLGVRGGATCAGTRHPNSLAIAELHLHGSTSNGGRLREEITEIR